jgi:hypothetical protein
MQVGGTIQSKRQSQSQSNSLAYAIGLQHSRPDVGPHVKISTTRGEQWWGRLRFMVIACFCLRQCLHSR